MEGKDQDDKPFTLNVPWVPNSCQQSRSQTVDGGYENGSEFYSDDYMESNQNKRTKLDDTCDNQFSTSKPTDYNEDQSVDFAVENEMANLYNVITTFRSDGSEKNLCQDSQYDTNRFTQHAKTKSSTLPRRVPRPCSEVLSNNDFPCSWSTSSIPAPPLSMSSGVSSFIPTSSTIENPLDTSQLMYQPETTKSDQGYMSQSTCSFPSPPEAPESQGDYSAMEQSSPFDNAQASEGCFMQDGKNQVGQKLSYQFLTYFKDRLETEMHRFWLSMCDLLYEQQDHVQMIANKVAEEKHLQSCTEPDAINETGDAKHDSKPQRANVDYKMPVGATDECLTAALTPIIDSLNSTRNAEHENKMKAILDIMSLSCSVSTLLAQPQFRS